MTLEHATIFLQVIVFLFAICVHESAHALVASKLGDPTARMLGRITLNPIRHIDLIGTVILPLLSLLYHFPMIGWAKPVPVDPRNFRHEMRDDILTSVAGPASNFLLAAVSLLTLRVVWSVQGGPGTSEGLETLLRLSFYINVLLCAFNLIPVPPLDGSHVLRHLMPESVRRVYDMVGMFGLLILFVAGGPLIGYLVLVIRNFLAAIFLRG